MWGRKAGSDGMENFCRGEENLKHRLQGGIRAARKRCCLMGCRAPRGGRPAPPSRSRAVPGCKGPPQTTSLFQWFIPCLHRARGAQHVHKILAFVMHSD